MQLTNSILLAVSLYALLIGAIPAPFIPYEPRVTEFNNIFHPVYSSPSSSQSIPLSSTGIPSSQTSAQVVITYQPLFTTTSVITVIATVYPTRAPPVVDFLRTTQGPSSVAKITTQPTKPSTTSTPPKAPTTSTPLKAPTTSTPPKALTTSTPPKAPTTSTSPKPSTTSTPPKAPTTSTHPKPSTTSTHPKAPTTSTHPKPSTTSTHPKPSTTSTPPKPASKPPSNPETIIFTGKPIPYNQLHPSKTTKPVEKTAVPSKTNPFPLPPTTAAPKSTARSTSRKSRYSTYFISTSILGGV